MALWAAAAAVAAALVSAIRTVVASLIGPSVRLDTSYCSIELSWLRPNRLSAIDAVLLEVPAAFADSGSDGYCKLVNEVSRQTLTLPPLPMPVVRPVVMPLLMLDVSMMSDVIDEFAFDDCLWGFLGPNVVITWNDNAYMGTFQMGTVCCLLVSDDMISRLF